MRRVERVLRAIASHLPDLNFGVLGVEGSRVAENVIRSAALCIPVCLFLRFMQKRMNRTNKQTGMLRLWQ